MFAFVIVLIVLTACDDNAPLNADDLKFATPSTAGTASAPADASAYAKQANRYIKSFLPKGWEEVYSDVSILGAGSVITYTYIYRDDIPLWRARLTAEARTTLQRACDGVIEPEMSDYGIDHPRVSYLYLHPKAPMVDASNIPTMDKNDPYVVPANLGPEPKLPVADSFACD